MSAEKTKRLVSACVATAIAVPLGLFTFAAPANSISAPRVVGSDSTILNAALTDLRTCLSKDGAILDVYFLIDNSRSMDQIDGKEGTDRDGLRFKAVERSLYPLIDLAGSGVEVNVAGGLFSREGSTVEDWLKLQPGSESQIGQFASNLGGTPAGGGTNWAAGIAEAQRQLSQQAANSDNHCQALVWVTDGGIDVERDPAKTADGVTQLCGVGPTDFTGVPSDSGLMANLRRSGVVVFGVQLQVSDKIRGNLDEGRISEQDSKFSYFKPVVEGSGEVDALFFNQGSPLGGSLACGAINEDAQGAVIVINEAGQFAEKFEELVACISDSCTFPPDALVKCVNGVCEIPVPQGIAAMDFYAPEGFDRRNVLNPDGAAVCLIEGCLPKVEADEGGLVRVPVRNTAGIWKILTDSPNVRPLLFAGLQIDLDPVEVDPRNPRISTNLRLKQSFGAQFDQANYENLSFSAEVSFPNGDKRPASVVEDGEQWKLTWDGSEEGTRGAIPNEVKVSLQATARGIAPDVPRLPLQVVDQVAQVSQKKIETFPTLVTPNPGETAFFSPIEGLAGAGSSTLVFEGPELNDGKVCWLADAQGFIGVVDDPAQRPNGTFVANIEAGNQQAALCPDGASGVVLPQGTQVPVEVTMTASEQSDALVTGTMLFELFGPEGEAGFPQEVPFAVETTIVKNNVARNIVLALLTLLGIGVPYLVLLFFARRQAAFNSQLDGNRWASLPVTVGPEGLVSLGEIDPAKYEFIFVEKSGLTRDIATGTETHKVLPPKLWPFKPVRTIVESGPGSSIFTNFDPETVSGNSQGVSSQVLSNVFYFVPNPQAASGTHMEASVDDWGNRVSIVATDVNASEELISGRLVVIASGEGNVAESTAKAVAKARMWPAWADIYGALMAVPPRVAEPEAPSSAEPSSEPSASQPNDWMPFGEVPDVNQGSESNKKPRFGMKKKSKEQKGSDEPGFNNDFKTDDW